MRTHLPRVVPCLVFLLTASLHAQAFTWRLETPTNAPSARFSACMAHDGVRGRTVLFGGYDGTNVRGDVWEWNGTTWLARFAPHYPPPRWMSAMAYDAGRQRVVLFGGFATTSSPLGDTWEWDGVDWVQRAPASSPTGRWSHCMTYDSERQRVVLFGGLVSQSGVFSNQTWEWDGANWQLRTPVSSPGARAESAMAYDPVRQRTVLFGGFNQNLLADTWEWDGTAWVVRPTTGVLVGGRRNHAMAYDAVRQRVVLFAGEAGSPMWDDTEEWDGNVWSQQSPATSPTGRQKHAMAFDSNRQRLVLFGGSPLTDQTWTRGQFGTPATATAYGNGCGAPTLVFAPNANARPILGQVASATIGNATSSIALVATGWSNTAYGPFTLPVTLAGIGMPGCDLLQSADVFGLFPTSLGGGAFAFDLALPNVLALAGLHVYLQAFAFAPGVNPLEVVVSNGIDWTLGDV